MTEKMQIGTQDHFDDLASYFPGSDILKRMATPVQKNQEEQVSLSLQQAKFLSEVQVPLGVEIGKLSITADKLIDLLPGQVFEFEFDALQPVALFLSGEKIGEARFVLEGEKLALEITTAQTAS